MALFRDVRGTQHLSFVALGGLLFVSLLGTASGCNWATFADDAAKAPVRSVGAPGNFKAQDFGRSLLPLSDGQGKAAAFLATSINDPTLAIVSFDASGGVSTAPIPGASLNDTEDSVISSMAEDFASSPLKLILGSPKVHNQGYGRIYSYALSPMLDAPVSTLPVATLGTEEIGLGRGLAVGYLGGIDAKTDYVVASDDRMVVMIDGTTPTAPTVSGGACDTTFDALLDPRYRLRRPLLTARLWNDGASATVQQLVSGSPHPSVVPGTLSFFSVTGSGPDAVLTCLTGVSAPKPEMRARFGASLASGDFNGDLVPDLLVGAPGQNAYVYFGPFPTGGVPTPVVITDTEGMDFGFSVAALNVDGKAGDEALVGDPFATVDGKTQAGRVTAFKWNAGSGAMETYKTYSDHSPEANANFGSTVNALKFCTSSPSPDAGTPCKDTETSHVLMIGASNEVFVFYREGANIPIRTTGDTTVSDVRGP